MFAKFWEPGKVKTRLAADVGEKVACEIYKSFLSHLICRCAKTANKRTVVFSPVERQLEFGQLTHDGIWDLAAQSGDGLGTRMRKFFEWAFEVSTLTPKNVILIGSDTPHLAPQTIENAFSLLADNDVVLGPCTDGGYYLVGMALKTQPIFDEVDWSTSRVLEQTLSQINKANLTCSLLEPMTDVDELKDLEELIACLESAGDQTDLLAAIAHAMNDKATEQGD